MTALRVGALVAVIIGAALGCLRRGVRRAPASMARARSSMMGERVASSSTWTVRIGAVVVGGPLERWLVRRYGSGLAIVGLTSSAVATRVVVGFAVVGLAVLAAAVSMMTIGVLPTTPFVMVGALAAGAVAAWTMVMDVGSKIAKARRALRHSTNEFVQLVAIGLTTDQSVEEAIRFALEVAGGASIGVIRDAVLTAPLRGVSVWEAISEVGASHDVRELSEFASAVERQGLQGVAIGSTVATLAASMRAKALDELERDADKANANLAGPTIGFVVSTIVFLAYPLALRISEAFGG